MKTYKISAVLMTLGLLFVVGVSHAYTPVPEVLDTVSITWLGTLLTGFAESLSGGQIDIPRAAVPIPGATWLLVSGVGFLGWFRPTAN